ncbi:MAG TPA: T9SS type A sorting domain-containing protein, partial [candidate division Zixibacteria bacterium]|nr:T9SS type A sorting domain-containing protein [candidate division Zixibacteria bacterium]
IFYVRVDQDAPTSVLTDKFRVELDDISLVGVDIVWPVDMTDRIWGEATDFFTRVDSVRYSVWDSLNDLYWNGASFVESDEEIWNEPALYNYDGLGWFPPDVVPYPHAPGIEEGTGQVLQWQSGLFTQPDFGYYRVRSKAFDDLGHVEEVFTEHNEKVLLFDNCPPTIEPRYPDAGAVYYIWDWVDSFVVYAYDECGFGPGGVHGGPVDDVKFWIMNPRGQYWGWMPVLGWRWHDWAVELPGVQINDSLWRPNNIPMLTEEGHYTMVVRAWDQNGNLRLNAWSWTLTVSGEFLTVEALPNDPGRDWFFVDEEFTLRVIAWSHPGVVDESFSHQFFFGDNMPLPENLEILTPEPYWAFRGTLDVVAKCDVPVLGLEVFVDAPTSGLPRASTAPIDIIQLIDDDLGGFVMDNPDDQGNFMWLHHNRTTQDPLYGDVDIDTMSVKIQAYHYFRDEDTDPLTSDWQPIAILDEASDGDSVRLLFDNDNEFTEYEYSMIVDLVIQGLGTIVQTDRIMLGSGRPIDNIPPQKVENLNISYVGGVTLLEWDMVTHGADDPPTPEINPHENIYYEIYRFTSPTEALDSGLEPTWVTGLGETEFIVPDVLDATQPYYYAVRARDFDDNVSPEFSNRVGKVDYEVAPGFSWLGYPLPVPGLVDPNDYIARLGIPLADLYSFNNAIGGWEELLVGGFGRDLFDDGTDNIFALSAWTGTARWTGYVPEPAEELNIAFELFPGFNGIILPLVRDDLTMASDLYFELEALGYEPVFVSRRVPGGAWQSIHVDGEGTVYLDFPIYPGHPYMVGIDGAGVWPVYPDRMPSLRKRSIDAKKVSVVPMPNTCFIPFFAEDNSRIDRVSVTATWGEQVRTGDVDDHIIRVELSDFVGIKPGEQVRLEVVGDDGLFVGERLITVGEDGVHLEPEMVLAKTTPTLPEHFALHGNVPNPFNPATSISFDLPERADVDLTIYNIEGRLVRRMVSNEMPAGYHNVVWDGRDESGTIAPAGVYFYQLRAGEFSARRRMMLVK